MRARASVAHGTATTTTTTGVRGAVAHGRDVVVEGAGHRLVRQLSWRQGCGPQTTTMTTTTVKRTQTVDDNDNNNNKKM